MFLSLFLHFLVLASFNVEINIKFSLLISCYFVNIILYSWYSWLLMKTFKCFFSDINELNLPKTCQVDFPDPDDLLNFKLIISPDEVRLSTKMYYILSSIYVSLHLAHAYIKWYFYTIPESKYFRYTCIIYEYKCIRFTNN